MTKTSKYGFRIIYYVIFLIIFVFSTNIILFVFQDEYNLVRSINNTKYFDISNDVNFRIDSFSETEDIFFSVEFTGWAYKNTEQKNIDKNIKLIFISDDASYEVETDILDRFDLRSQLRANNIYSINHGFISNFSTIYFQNGVYKLYIYCYENDQTSAIINTNKVYFKSFRGFKELDCNEMQKSNNLQ